MVRERYFEELKSVQDRAGEDFEKQMERNPDPRDYFIKLNPERDHNEDVRKSISVIRNKEGLAPTDRRRDDLHDDLLPVRCALLLARRGLDSAWVADQLDLSTSRVEELAREGRKLLEG